MATHPAVVTTAPRAPLSIRHVPTVVCAADEVRVRVDWTATTPFDLHQADGGLVVTHGVLGSSYAGVVIELGVDVRDLSIGSKVFGFGFRGQQEHAFQLFVTVPMYLCGEIPSTIAPSAAVTIPDSFATAVHSVTAALHIPLPWPVPGHPPANADTLILIWGAASSAGTVTLQVLVHWGYRNVLATASPHHHVRLRELGAAAVFDYRDTDCVEQILETARMGRSEAPSIPLVLDCIGSVTGSIRPIARLTEAGTRVAVLLPVVIRAPSTDELPEYAMEVAGKAVFAEGVSVEGVRTHAYLENGELKARMQSEMMPALMAVGAVGPLSSTVVEGASLLERAERALAIMRDGISRQRLVWQVSGEGE
ncbi:hypothetical protein LTR08_001727 [Meristemomyces frigidus]|nr:hypothetical protein LTR08_001727 [Meristemomyces frigidus]